MTPRPPTIGVLGGGQLARMLTLDAARLGVRVHAYDPSPHACARDVAAKSVHAPFDDLDEVAAFAEEVDAVTFDTEHVPVEAALAAAQHAPVLPGVGVLEVAQNRLKEKRLARSIGLGVAEFTEVLSERDAEQAAETLGVPFLLKGATEGYDGKGQRRIDNAGDAPGAWRDLGGRACIAEALVNFQAELSVIVARSADGSRAQLGPFRNVHVSGVLDHTVWPAKFTPGVERDALESAWALADALDLVGVLCVEFFVDQRDRVLMNEIAPRPHNSGHLTIEAFTRSQFTLQACCALGRTVGPIAESSPAAAMVNLLGVAPTPEAAEAVLTNPHARLHLYSKGEPSPGRKMGHITVTSATPEGALEDALQLRSRLLAGANDRPATTSRHGAVSG